MTPKRQPSGRKVDTRAQKASVRDTRMVLMASWATPLIFWYFTASAKAASRRATASVSCCCRPWAAWRSENSWRAWARLALTSSRDTAPAFAGVAAACDWLRSASALRSSWSTAIRAWAMRLSADAASARTRAESFSLSV